MQRKLLFYLASICFSLLSVQAQKNDTIYLKNGDRITGELKKFEYGLLDLSTDAMKTISIEFDEINSIHSAKYFEIRLNSGTKYFGHLQKSETMSTVNVVTVTDTIPKRLWDIVLIMPIKSSFFQKIDGSVDLGLTYTKASDIFQYSLNSQVTYRTTYYSSRLSLESILTDDGTDVTKNNTVRFTVSHLLSNKRYTRISAQVQQNTELNLDYRAQAGYGLGYDITRNNAFLFTVLGGLVANQEKTLETVDTSENLEAIFATQVKWFKYRHPKIDITSGLEIYTSVTSFGRVRMEYDLSAKYELIKDLFLNVQLYDNFDNEPTQGGESRNDWGIITSIGFTF
jgi:hypothetical protein